MDVSKYFNPPPPPHNWLFLFETNATMHYHDATINVIYKKKLDSYFSFLIPILEAFEFGLILKVIIMKV